MLRTKLNKPSPSSKLIFRKELIQTLEILKDRRLALVSAPAGYGKSTLISQWIDQCEISCMWYSLDKSDNDIVIFLQYIIAGILSNYDNLEFKTEKLLESNTTPSHETLATFLINDLLEIKESFYIIFDDYHLIENKEINVFIYYLLSNLPDHIHMVLVTRSDPPIPLARLRSQQLVTDIRMSDLSFNANNIYDFFRKSLNINLSIEDAKNLESKTEGWIAGLQLAGLSLQSRDDISDYVKKLKGDNRYIMDYLLEEVLQQQNTELRDFLLFTSILKRFNSSLCNHVLSINNSQEIIDQLEKENMFIVSLDSERNWYRYHHLFADLLQKRLEQNNYKYLTSLHKKAISWLENNEMYDLAIEHTIHIKNYQKTSQLLSIVVEDLWKKGRHDTVLKYGDLLPDETALSNPILCLYYAWILIFSGKIDKAEMYLSSAYKKVKKLIANKNSIENERLLGKIAVALACHKSHSEHSDEIFDYCSLALDKLSDEKNPIWLGWVWFSYGIAYFSKGNLQESKNAFDKAYVYGKKSDNIYLISTIVIRMAENENQLGEYISSYKKCTELLSLIKDKGFSQITKAEWTYAPLYLIMGTTELGWAELDKAEENIKIAYNLSKKGNDNFLRIYVLIVYSTVLIYLDKPESKELVRELEDLIKQTTVPPFIQSFYILWRVHILTEQNELDKATEVIEENGLTLDGEKHIGNEGAYAAFARLLIKQCKIDEAEKLLSELYSLAKTNNGIDRMIELKFCYTLLYRLKDEKDKAVNSLIKALEMASKEEQLFSFVFWSDKLHDELEAVYKLQATRKTNIPQSFINKIKEKIKNKNKHKKENDISDISGRELETLALIAEGLSNQEIAEKLFLSIHTIKSHVKSILFKLNVDNRSKAVVKAKELNII